MFQTSSNPWLVLGVRIIVRNWWRKSGPVTVEQELQNQELPRPFPLLSLLFSFSIISSSCFCCWVYSRRYDTISGHLTPLKYRGRQSVGRTSKTGGRPYVEISTYYEIWVIPHDHYSWTAKVGRNSQRRSGACLSKQARGGLVLPRLR